VWAGKRNFTSGPHFLNVRDGSDNVTAESCASCHLPHNAGAKAKILLWAPAMATGSFTTYTGSQGIADGTAVAAPTTADSQAHTYLCLSCHDATAATANFTGAGRFFNTVFTGTLSDGSTTPSQPDNTEMTLITGTGTGNGSGVTDLSDDHPVNFSYPATGTEPVGYEDIVNVGLGSSDGGTTFDLVALPLYGSSSDEMQCSTCHEPHDQNLTGAKFYLRGSAVEDLCTTCHL
jgi:nitrate/TMAO reductase-like tetraheme cytochrome c subunit